MSEENSSGDDQRDAPGVSDGDRPPLRVGATAESIGNPQALFGRLGEEFVVLPVMVAQTDELQRCEREPGVYELAALSEEEFEVIEATLETVDPASLSDRLVEETVLDETAAQVMLLFEGFELDVDEIADQLDTTEDAIADRIRAIYDRFDEEAIVEEVRSAHPDLPADAVAVFVLAEGFSWDREAIASELELTDDEVERALETATERYDTLAETLGEAVARRE